MIAWIIYFTGSILAYRRMRRAWLNEFKDDNPWGSVFVSFLAAIISWIGFIIAVVIDPEPPSIKFTKWL